MASVTDQIDDEHIANLEEVLKRLQDHGVKINRKKWSFLQDSVEYLGRRIDRKHLNLDGFSLLLTILKLCMYLKIIVMLYISARIRMHACSAYEPRPHLFVQWL